MMRKPDAFDELFEFYRDFDRFFRSAPWQNMELPRESLEVRRLLPAAPANTTFNPPVECFTRDKMLVLKAELPGVDPKDVEVTVIGNRLFLRGEKKVEHKTEEKNRYFQEVSHGRFERVFALPEGVKMDQVKARFHNGILELTMPSGVAEPARTVPIEIGEGGIKVKAA